MPRDFRDFHRTPATWRHSSRTWGTWNLVALVAVRGTRPTSLKSLCGEFRHNDAPFWRDVAVRKSLQSLFLSPQSLRFMSFCSSATGTCTVAGPPKTRGPRDRARLEPDFRTVTEHHRRSGD